ncbi:MAG: hypothetical protein AAB473_00450 [Patescibacteria group bacterium]
MPKFEQLMGAMKNTDSEGSDARMVPEGPHWGLPRDVDIDHEDLREEEIERRREFLGAAWEEILSSINGPKKGIEQGRLEEILDAASGLSLEKKEVAGGVNDLLFTLRNLLSEDDETRGLGEIRIACHTHLWEVDNESSSNFSRSVILMAFDHFQEAYENYLFTGTFRKEGEDYYVRELVEEFVRTNGAAVLETREDAIYVQAVYAAIRAMGYVGIQPETLLKKKTPTIEVRTDISGVSDEQLLQKIQRAPMFSRDGSDRVLGMDQGHDVLGIVLYSEQRPTLLPAFADALAAVKQSGRLTNEARKAKSLGELMRLSRGKLYFNNGITSGRYWRYAYQTSERIDAPWEEAIIGWHDNDGDE